MSFVADPHARWVLIFRWIVFLLAAGYSLHQIVIASDYSEPGGPFRYLTIWALLLSFFSASRMLAYSERRSDLTWPNLVAVTAVVNALVVVMYWRLWLQDPALVNSRGPLPWWLEWYLHALGPLLQWIDAIFIYGAFRKPIRSLIPYGIVVFLYIGWIEGFVRRANEFPFGKVTSGLPYPFLNDLQVPERIQFYATTAAAGVVFMVVFWGVAWLVRRYVYSSFPNKA